MGTNVRLPMIHKTCHAEVFLSLQGHKQSLSLEINPADNAERYPQNSIVGSHSCDECLKSILPFVCHMPESIL